MMVSFSGDLFTLKISVTKIVAKIRSIAFWLVSFDYLVVVCASIIVVFGYYP